MFYTKFMFYSGVVIGSGMIGYAAELATNDRGIATLVFFGFFILATAIRDYPKDK